MLPKKLHLYWSNDRLPYLSFLTAFTFKHLNPQWEINLWTPLIKSQLRTWASDEHSYSEKFSDWTARLYSIADVVHIVDMRDLGVGNDISEIHKSDLLRYWFLYQQGGIYSDTDILYFKPVDSHLFEDHESFICPYSYGNSIGFLAAHKGSKFYEFMFDQARNGPFDSYQNIGAELMNRLAPGNIEGMGRISMDMVYHYNADHVKEIFESDLIYPEISIGQHWYAGHPWAGEFLNATNGGMIPFKAGIGKMIPPPGLNEYGYNFETGV